jgi:hypothetical protein
MKKPNLALFKNKKVQLAAAGVAAIGLVVLLKKNGDTTTPAAGGGATNTGTLDSTGTDSYNAIGQLGQAWQDEWNQAFTGFSSQLTDINTTLGGLKQPGTTVPPPPATNPTVAPGVGWIFVKPGQTVASIVKASKGKITEAQIRQYNTANALNRFSPGETIRIRGRAGAKPAGSL